MKKINHHLDKMSAGDLQHFVQTLFDDLSSIDGTAKEQKQQIRKISDDFVSILQAYPLVDDRVDLRAFDDHLLEQQITSFQIQGKSLCLQKQQQELFLLFNEWLIAYQLWRISQQGKITVLEPLVNGIAEFANVLSEPADLSYLSTCLRSMVNNVHDSFKEDILNTDPRRPWRVLLMNYAIVSTRSHDPALIDRSYQLFTHHLPEDAGLFFTEAMSQMVAQNYPQYVREVVKQYYQQYSEQSLHKKLH